MISDPRKKLISLKLKLIDNIFSSLKHNHRYKGPYKIIAIDFLNQTNQINPHKTRTYHIEPLKLFIKEIKYELNKKKCILYICCNLYI